MDRLQLSNPFLEGANNIYLSKGDPVTIVDTGVSTADTRREFAELLLAHGLDYADIDKILLTHWHTDHAGLAGDIQTESGADILLHEADVGLAAQSETAWKSLLERCRELFQNWGLPDEEHATALDLMDNRDEHWGRPADIRQLDEGDRIEIGDTIIEAINTPGHTLGSTCYVTEDGQTAFVGDTLLPGYTPNIGGADLRTDSSILDQYLETLQTIIQWDLERALPGHGVMITDPSDRASSTIHHHFDRMRDVLNVLNTHGALNVWKVAKYLFGDLNSIHISSGCGEAAFHLGYMYRYDILQRTEGTYAPLPNADVRLAEHISEQFGDQYLR